MIEVKNLSKKFDSYQALNDINFSVNKHEVISIIGPSGSGKSTLLRTLNLLVTPDKGSITIGDAHIVAESLKRQEIIRLRKKNSMVFQHYNLFRNKTALENISEVLRFARGIAAKEAAQTALSYLDRVGLADKAHAYPATLSGGQQQRVGIARALSLQPEVILMDEPTSSLDPEMRRGILRLISDIAQQKLTMLIVTHEMNFAREISDRILFMEHGAISAQGTPGEIFDKVTSTRVGNFIYDYEI